MWRYELVNVLWNPCRFYPSGVACGAEGGLADFLSTTSGAAPTSPPERVIRSILRKEYRRAVGTHYGQTRRHQAGYSPRHRRDSRAGTTMLVSNLVVVLDWILANQRYGGDDYNSAREKN